MNAFTSSIVTPFLLCLLVIHKPLIASQKGLDGVLIPEDWYLLPEDQLANNENVIENDGRDILDPTTWISSLSNPPRSFNEKVFELFSANQGALNDLDRRFIHKYGPSNIFRNWYLDGVETELGIGLKWGIGVVAIGGSSAIRTLWQKPDSPNFLYREGNRLEEDSSEDESVIDLNEYDDRDRISEEVKAISQMAVQTGKVSNGSEMASGIMSYVDEARAMTYLLNDSVLSGWQLKKYTLELSISATGKVYVHSPVAVNVGGGLRLKIEWSPNTNNVPRDTRSLSKVANALANSTLSLTKVLCSDLNSIVDYKTPFYNYKLSGVTVTLATSLSGKVGVASIKGGTSGALHFSPPSSWNRDDRNTSATDRYEEISYISLIADVPTPEHLEYARRIGVTFEPVEYSSEGSPSIAEYNVPRAMFRNGLKATMKMGKFFAGVSKKISDSEYTDWDVSKLKVAHSISLSGGIVLVTLTGSTALELTFDNLDFQKK